MRRLLESAQMNVLTSRVAAGCFALSAFAVAIIAGLSGENSSAQILLRAIVAMFVSYPVGWLLGIVCQRVIAAQTNESAEENIVASNLPSAPSQRPHSPRDKAAIVG